jgi:hypothetical protein
VKQFEKEVEKNTDKIARFQKNQMSLDFLSGEKYDLFFNDLENLLHKME